MISREDMKPGSRFNALFHQAWGQAKSSPEYDKKVWNQLDEMIHSGPPVKEPEVRSEAYASMSSREQWADDKRTGRLDD